MGLANFQNSGFMNSLMATSQREPERAPLLVEEIVEKSAGVFLWVTLVVKSLLEGLQNSDRISDLQRRLRQLPADLEDLYLVMIGSLEPFYEQQASHIFQIVTAARQPLSVLAVSFADEEDPNFAVLAKMPLDRNKMVFRFEDTVRRLNSRCRGLLEVRNGSSAFGLDSKVEFLHRTVKDFLETPSIWNRILSQSAPNFDVDISLMRSYLLQLKTLHGTEWAEEIFGKYTGEFMEFAAGAEGRSDDMQLSLLDSFFETATTLWKLRPQDENAKRLGQVKLQHDWVEMVPPQRNVVCCLSLAASFGLRQYVENSLARYSPLHMPQLSRSIVYFAAVPAPLYLSPRLPNTKLVAFLLESGANPNQPYGGSSVWKYILKYVCENCKRLCMSEHREILISLIEVMRLLVEAGADPEACIPFAADIVSETFGWLLPEQSIDLRQLIGKKLEEKPGRALDEGKVVHGNIKARSLRDRSTRTTSQTNLVIPSTEKVLQRDGPMRGRFRKRGGTPSRTRSSSEQVRIVVSKVNESKSSGKLKKQRLSRSFKKLMFWTWRC
ncbi:uncharacterized protein BP5553_06554 [Venustampulla echinocandica]|uniref:DUF7791 domain-containing protein n=1 Tax=Venustampulla echinocandica TaxID=2656787 RepID=A0A370TK92_9HELO|nr:uncharacterized protein BP5553_06554 [Venustampulla echinocandica]RDL35942.1 hypothetical protein BP5553_06554 [Venustampulla echinocandica]